MFWKVCYAAPLGCLLKIVWIEKTYHFPLLKAFNIKTKFKNNIVSV